MDMIRFGAFVILAITAVPATAQTVYRCKTGDGYAYQDRPCAAHADAGTHSIRTTAGGTVPPAVRELMRAAELRVQSEREQAVVARMGRAPPRPAAAPAPQRRKGYRCRVQRGMTTIDYYQYEPCPELMPVGTHSGSTSSTSNGETLITTYTIPIMSKTEQKEMSARQACEGMRSQIDPYERYKRRNHCNDL